MKISGIVWTNASIAIIGTVCALLPLVAATATRDVRGNSRNSAEMESKIVIPSCNAMEQIAAGMNSEDQLPINRWQVALTLTSGVAAPEFEESFGIPILSWKRADFNAFTPAANECIKAATKAKQFEAQKQLLELRRVVKYHQSRPLNSINKARQEVASNLEILEAQPSGIEMLKIVALLGQLQNISQQKGAIQVRRPIEQMQHSAATPARWVAHSIQNLPQGEADGYFARIHTLRDGLVEQVLADLDQNLNETPESVPGLIIVDRITTTANELSGVVPDERLAKIKADAEQMRQWIWNELETWIASVPNTSEGSQKLDEIYEINEYKQLKAEDRIRLNELITAQREQIAGTTVNNSIEQLETFAKTVEGLRQLVAFAVTQRRELSRQNTPGARQSFEEAYREVHQSRIDSVEDEFENFLDAVPITREGVVQIRTTLREINAPRTSGVYQAGMNRAREIAGTVTKAERHQQCRQALPDVDLNDDEAAQLVVGFSGEPLLLGELLCDIALAGNNVHGYEGPGFFDEDHQLQITGRDGIYRTYILNPVPIGPDREALLGVKVMGPTNERALDVNQWRSTLAILLPANKAGRKNRCAELMQTPDSQLSAQDRMEAVGCVMGSLFSE